MRASPEENGKSKAGTTAIINDQKMPHPYTHPLQCNKKLHLTNCEQVIFASKGYPFKNMFDFITAGTLGLCGGGRTSPCPSL